jgi:transcriptional regulator with XRE-family HTH domain
MSIPIKHFLRLPYNRERMGHLGIIASQRVREAREAAGLTQAELAEYLHISRDAVSKIENGYSVLSLKHLAALPNILHRPISYFLDLETDLTIVEAVRLIVEEGITEEDLDRWEAEEAAE